MKNKNLKILKELFWDYKWSSVIKKLDSPFVIARVLEIGNKEQVKELERALGKEKINDFLKKYEKLLSKQSLNSGNYAMEFKQKELLKEHKEYDKVVIRKAVTYFEDAENEPEIPVLKKSGGIQ